MNTALWIALGAAALVILAHVALFWFFLGRPGRGRAEDSRSSEKDSGASPGADSRNPPNT